MDGQTLGRIAREDGRKEKGRTRKDEASRTSPGARAKVGEEPANRVGINLQEESRAMPKRRTRPAPREEPF